MPNALAMLMLLIWPGICVWILNRYPLERAIVWVLLGGLLILPPLAAFDLPLVPSMDKFSIPSVTLLALLMFKLKLKVRYLPENRIAKWLVAVFVLSVVPTVFTNPDPVGFVFGALPGLGLRDLFSVIVSQMIVLIPFVIGRQFMATDTGLREILLALMIGMLVYTIPSLIEIRFSPQINVWVYGFFQHDFEQMMRKGGFRPLVFLPHALWLAFFMLCAIISTAALSRTVSAQDRPRYLLALGYLFVVLVMCKSLASLGFALVLTPLVLLGTRKMQIRAAFLAGVIAVTYPILRNTGLIPLEDILARANAIDPLRAGSLAYRFNNEEQLLARAAEKPWFGWGGWGRNLIRHYETGEILTIPDGRWIIVFGTFGWVGYIAEMGLLASPLMLLWQRTRRFARDRISPFVAPIAVILAATLMDMLLNATLTPYTWLCAGAVLGYAEKLKIRDPAPQPRQMFGDGPVLGKPRKSRQTAL